MEWQAMPSSGEEVKMEFHDVVLLLVAAVFYRIFVLRR
jgi:hypothetical protein